MKITMLKNIRSDWPRFFKELEDARKTKAIDIGRVTAPKTSMILCIEIVIKDMREPSLYVLIRLSLDSIFKRLLEKLGKLSMAKEEPTRYNETRLETFTSIA